MSPSGPGRAEGTPPIGRTERWRLAAVAADAADPGLRDASVALRVCEIATWDRARFRRVVGSMAALFVALQVAGRFGSPVVNATLGGLATLVLIASSFVLIGRWVRMQPRTFRRIAVVSAVLLCLIIVSGAAVRLTGSGLGCPTWPNCHDGSLTAKFGESGWHDDIEFANRLVTGLLVIAAGLGVLGAVARRPYRRELTQLGWIVVVLIMGNAVLGGFVVLFHLMPQIVMSHFLLSIASVAVGLAIVHRTAEAHPSSMLGRERVASVDRTVVLVGRFMTVSALIAIFLGTIVTGAGPHGGDPSVERFHFSMRTATRWHGTAVWVLLATVVVLSVLLARRAVGPRRADLLRRCTVLLAVIVVQGGIGYVQYFNQVPAGLVQLHVIGAVSVWAAVLWVRAGLTAPVASVADGGGSDVRGVPTSAPLEHAAPVTV